MINPFDFIKPVTDLLDKFIPDKDLKEKLKFEIVMSAQNGAFQTAIEQLKVNTQEASHPSVFVAGWRPFIGWTCGAGLIYNFIIYPLLLWGIAITGSTIVPPPLFSENLMELVLGMLGLGALRTYEKFKGVERNKI
jgi:hypothetical protein